MDNQFADSQQSTVSEAVTYALQVAEIIGRMYKTDQ